MARRQMNDGADVFRVVVQRCDTKPNPDYVWGDNDQPERLNAEWATWTEHYGPYNTLGAARGQLTHHTYDYYEGRNGRLPAGVLGGHIEQATVSWSRVSG